MRSPVDLCEIPLPNIYEDEITIVADTAPTSPPTSPQTTNPYTNELDTYKFRHIISNLRTNYSELYKMFALFSLWLASFEQVVAILPYALTAPLLFVSNPSRRVTLGLIVKTSNAFSQSFGALSVISDRWIELTDYVSVVKRLMQWETFLNVHSSKISCTQLIEK